MEKKNKTPKKTRFVGIGLAIVAVYGALSVIANQYGEIFPGVTVLDVDLGGLTPLQAEERLEERLPRWLDAEPITITADGEVLGTFLPSQLGATVSARQLVQDAWQIGRTKGRFLRGWELLCHWCGKTQEIQPMVSYDENALSAVVSAMAEAFDRLPQAASCTLEKDGLYAVKELYGRTLDKAALTELVTRSGQTDLDAPWEMVTAQPLDLEEVAAQYPEEAQNPYYDAVTQTVVEGTVGVKLNSAAAGFALSHAQPGERLQLPATLTYPARTAAELASVLFRDCLSTATTLVSGTAVRRSNVRLAGESCNGVVLNSGEIFDYNLVVGERTAARGFGAAASYVNGKTVDTVGGGICQVSSTIYLSALLANLEITERYAHRFYPGYIGLGLDATVSWGGPEFRFCNNTEYPVQLRVSYVGNRLTVQIYGTRTDDTYVKMSHELLDTTAYQTIYKETEELPWGTQKQEQSGYVGRRVITYRSVYSGNGTLLSRTEEAKSDYKSRDEIILVGIQGRPEESQG